MQWLWDLLTNPYLIISLSSWLVAQVLKTIIHAFIYKKWDWHRMVGDGGMPSCHSATVTALAVTCGLGCGMGSAEFAVSAILAVIVCHDAMGVRLETGKQAQVLNELIKAFQDLSTEELPEVKLKEFVGHTLIQVLAGVLVGLGNALLMYWLLF